MTGYLLRRIGQSALTVLLMVSVVFVLIRLAPGDPAAAYAGQTASPAELAQVREQFGRAIGSFQAVKHRLADLFVAVESARSLSQAAGWAVATRDDRAAEFAAMAKSFCCETYADVAAEGIQLHGGIGITWEHEAHLHLKRAHSTTHLFGTPRRHRERLEDLLGLAGSAAG